MSDRASLRSTNGKHASVRLEEVTQQHLGDWGVTYNVYRAEPGVPFMEVKSPENEESPLYKSGQQTLMQSDACKPPGFEEPSGSEHPSEPLDAYADVRWYFRKNEQCDTLRFEGHKHNPFRHDDIIFHLPYFQHIGAHLPGSGNDHTSDEVEVEKNWCFDYEWTGVEAPALSARFHAFMDTIRQSISLRRFKKNENADEEHGAPDPQTGSTSRRLCFESKAFTICMLPFLDGKKLDDGEGPEKQGRTNCKSWIALIIAPGDIVRGQQNAQVDGLLLDGNLASRSHAYRKNRYRPRWSKEHLSSRRDADYFQTCLIEVGMKKITAIWNDNVDKAIETCHAFERVIHGSIHRSPNGRSDYWRKYVNDDLLSIYKLQKRLESLQANLFNTITNHQQGIWSNFRKARPGRRLDLLEKRDKPQAKKGKRDKLLQGENDEDNLERERLQFLLYGCVDRYWDRLYGQDKKLRQTVDELQALRGLVSLAWMDVCPTDTHFYESADLNQLVELSQTRASLYANDLGDNVMSLTYINILFLPLSFCTSLWAMNYVLPFDAFVPTICVTSAVKVGVLAFVWTRLR